MFIGNGFMEMVDALFGDLGSLILVAVICFCLHHFTKKSRLKARCLKIASLATEDFYQKAEKLLEDTATPDILKRHIYELTIAVTDERAAEIALEVIISSLMNSHEKKLKPDSALIRELDQVRKHRPDIVDTFNDAVRASFASILFSHNSKASVLKWLISRSTSRFPSNRTTRKFRVVESSSSPSSTNFFT